MLSISEEGDADDGKREEKDAKQHRDIQHRRNTRNQHHHQLPHSLHASNKTENSNRIQRDEIPRHQTSGHIERNRIDAGRNHNGKHIDQPERISASPYKSVRKKRDAEFDGEVQN